MWFENLSDGWKNVVIIACMLGGFTIFGLLVNAKIIGPDQSELFVWGVGLFCLIGIVKSYIEYTTKETIKKINRKD